MRLRLAWAGLLRQFTARGDTMVEQPNGLITVLLDESVDQAERGDAALDLREYPNKSSEDALREVLKRPSTHPLLAEDCAESLAFIWCERGAVDLEFLRSLDEAASSMARGVLRRYCPDLLACG